MGGTVPEPHDGEVWYFGYGSMCNPVSLKRRGIMPRTSIPSTLDGYRLVFNTSAAMANIERSPDSSLHGILHLITDDLFSSLVELEAAYDRTEVPCVPYDNQTIVRAHSFMLPPHKVPPALTPPTLPTERYMTIILQGLRHFGASEDWVAKLASQPFDPSRSPSQYLKVHPASNPEQLPTMTMEQLQQHTGKLPVTYAIGHKVVQLDVTAAPEHPMVEVLRKLVSGTQGAFLYCSTLYEPRLPEVSFWNFWNQLVLHMLVRGFLQWEIDAQRGMRMIYDT